MKKRKGLFLLSLGGIFLFGLAVGEGFGEIARARLDSTEQLRREIRLLNLLNGLELEPSQIALILSRAAEAKRLREEWEREVLLKQDKLEATLGEIKKFLTSGREIPSSIAQDYHRFDRELKAARHRMDDGVRHLAGEVRAGLASHQLYQLEKFVPCIIPPKGETRIGQAQDFTGLAARLERIRAIPSGLYERRKHEIAWRIAEEMKLRAPRGLALDEEEASEHILRTLDQVRSLDTAAFEIQKEALSRELVSPFKPVKPDLPGGGITQKIEVFLLSPEVIPILEGRIQSGKD